MTTEETKFTVGKTTFYQGENQTHPLFRSEAGIPCQSAREQTSELMGYARDMTLDGLMEDKPQLTWASHYICALAKALMDDADPVHDALNCPPLTGCLQNLISSPF